MPIIASLLAGGALILMAWSVAPVPDQDASYFIGTSMSLAAGDGLVNRVDGLLWTRDPEGQARLMSYPVVWPSVLGMLGGTGVRRTAVAVACVATLSLILTALLLQPLATRSLLGGTLAALSVASYASAFANGSMRPEALSSGLIVLLALALPRLPSTGRREVLVGAFAGALAHVQVPLGIYAVLAWSGWISFALPLRKALPRGGLVAFAACCTFGYGLYLHPFGGAEYLASLGHIMSGLPSEFSWRGWLSYWVVGVRFPALLMTMGLGAAAACRLARGAVRPASPTLLAVTVTVFLALFLKNTVPIPSRWYEAIIVLPFAYYALGSAASPSRQRDGVTTALIVLSVIALAANGLGIVRRMLVWTSGAANETTFSEARALVRRELQDRAPSGVVATTSQAWMLLPDFRRACIVPLGDALSFGTSCRVRARVLILQQARRPTGLAAPLKVVTGDAGSAPTDAIPLVTWRLVADHFSRKPNALSRAISPRASGWGFAVYVRDH